MSIKNSSGNDGTLHALSTLVMRGYITETDFQECDEAFPGIVRYYRELKDKPKTFLELLWSYTHRHGHRVESCPVASLASRRPVSR